MADLASLMRGVLPPERVRMGVPFSAMTTWRVGGPAGVLVEPTNEDEAAEVIRVAVTAHAAVWVIGRGSNLLAADRGLGGLVIRPSVCFDRLDIKGIRVRGAPGVRLPALAWKCAGRGLAGLEFAVGIPGTLGGGVATNAGAEGMEIGSRVGEIRTLRASGTVDVWNRDTAGFMYRHSRFLEEPAFILAVAMDLEEDDPEAVRRRTRNLVQERRKQPKGRSAGSVFRNPEGDYAGRLLEGVGAKGMTIGGARVPWEHANFILTDESACADDVLRLIKTLQDRVFESVGTLLKPEVILAGFDEDDPHLPKGARLLKPLG